MWVAVPYCPLLGAKVQGRDVEFGLEYLAKGGRDQIVVEYVDTRDSKWFETKSVPFPTEQYDD